ncbi:hypothetical protein JTE90_013788 [Oedothorax gibbosus]|uniref:Uncharacterized protein n=1 Tax=Oedothorax gibbosus TaxID=931172 RepID=A0AAV6V0H0_9ARAC|nr:hypothetical protein JTE90_013788 [Oedothorax gibbosus]
MHSKFLVIFFLCLCVFNKLSKSSVIDHVEVFETEENLANETQVLETSTLASTTFKDATDQPETTLPIEKTEVPKVPENTDAFEVSENTQVHDHGAETPNTPETGDVPHVLETTYIPVPENTEAPNVLGSSVSTAAPTIELSETISMSSLPKTTTVSVTRPSPPQRFVPRHRIESRTPKKHATSPLFEMCPPLGEKCPACSVPQNQLTRYMCYFPVVLKVLLLSPPETDASGRICGKLGKLLVHGTMDSKQFRSLLRFSIKDACDCNLKVSQHYFLFTQVSEFIKQGRVYSKIALSDQSLLFPVDPYTEPKILQVLRSCSPEQIGIIPIEEIPQDAIRVDSKHESLDTQVDLQSVPHHPSPQEFLSPDSTLQVSARSARNPYRTNPSASYLPPNTNLYLPPMLTPSPVQYPALQMNLANFPTMTPFRPFDPIPTFKPLFSHNQPQPSFYLPPLVYNNAHPEVHKSVAYSSSNPGHQVSVQTDVRYDSKTGSIKVAQSGMVPSSGTEYSGRPPITFPQGNQHMEHSSGTIQMSYEPPQNTPKSSVNIQNAHVMTSSIHQNPEQQYNSSSSFSSSASSTISGQSQRLYVSTNCLNAPLASSCPYCASYDATEFSKVYCNSTYAFLSTMTFPGRSSRRGGNSYECVIVQSQLLHDISKDAGKHNLFQSLQLLLPAHCDCLSNQIDPAVILFLGNTDPQPKAPQTQLSKDHILIRLPAPSDTTLPICQPYKTREEVKSAVSYQPPIEYDSVISPSSSPLPVIQDPVPEPSKSPEVVEYSSTIPYPPSTENSPSPVAKLDVKTPDYKPVDYREPASSNTPYGAMEPNYPDVSSAAPEPLQNYEPVHRPEPSLSNPIPEASSNVVEHSAHYQQPANEEQPNTLLTEKPAYEDGPPIHQPMYEASTPVPPVSYSVPPSQVHLSGILQTLPQQPYETVGPQMQNYEAAKSSSHPTYIQEYESTICPSNVVQSCPLNNGRYEDSHAPHYCAAPFAIIVELLGPGFQRPYYTFPRISIKTTSSSVGEGKTVVVSVSEPQPLSCSQRSVKIVKNIGTDQENFQEGNKIPIVLVSSCHFEYAARNIIFT